ncbi:hypothetical protein HY251_10020 [bacterium]|nr:hypothetical protein [bacterium]
MPKDQIKRERFCMTGEPQTVEVIYVAGHGQETITRESVAGFDVEEIAGGKFLVLATPNGKRTYVAYDKILVVTTEAGSRKGSVR